MKRMIAITALTLTAATGASAMTDSPANLATIERYAGTEDVSGLTATQITGLLNIIHGGDSEGEKRDQVQWMLEKYNG